MKVATWIASALLALAFVATGCGKLFASTSDLHESARGVPVALLRTAGVAELLGAFGLILPAVTRIAPKLTPVAACGLVLTMIGATVTNLAVGEPGMAVVTVVLGAGSAFVAWARLGACSVTPRSRRGIKPAPAAAASSF